MIHLSMGRHRNYLETTLDRYENRTSSTSTYNGPCLDGADPLPSSQARTRTTEFH